MAFHRLVYKCRIRAGNNRQSMTLSSKRTTTHRVCVLTANNRNSFTLLYGTVIRSMVQYRVYALASKWRRARKAVVFTKVDLLRTEEKERCSENRNRSHANLSRGTIFVTMVVRVVTKVAVPILILAIRLCLIVLMVVALAGLLVVSSLERGSARIPLSGEQIDRIGCGRMAHGGLVSYDKAFRRPMSIHRGG